MTRTEDIAQIAKVSIEEATQIHDFIDNWLELDWSEASERKIKSTIKEAQSMMQLWVA